MIFRRAVTVFALAIIPIFGQELSDMGGRHPRPLALDAQNSIVWTGSRDQIIEAFDRVSTAAKTYLGIDPPPQLVISADPVINAFARSGDVVQINLALAELISDSPSELGFAIAHEFGHILQQRIGHLAIVDNPEFDADILGLFVSIGAGYDPYAGAGTLAKLSMVSGTAGLLTQFENQLGPDAHKSFNQRIELMFDALVLVCGWSPDLQALCNQYRSIVHPHFPPSSPMSAPHSRHLRMSAIEQVQPSESR